MFDDTAGMCNGLLSIGPLDDGLIPVGSVPLVYEERNIHATGNVRVEARRWQRKSSQVLW